MLWCSAVETNIGKTLKYSDFIITGMDNVKNEQEFKRIKIIIIFLTVGLTMVLTPAISNVNSLPPDSRWGGQMDVNCTGESKGDRWFVTCCWREPVPGKILGQTYCQKCENTGSSDNPNWKCDPKQPQAFESTSNRYEVVNPNNGKILEETQTTNPTFEANKGTVLEKNLAEEQQPMQFSQNNEKGQESEELTETNNANTASNNQEDDVSPTSDTTDSEMTTSLSKRGNAQNSPVPPECPNQGPIPPDCTMKPKF